MYMALLGLFDAFVGTLLADLRGNERTRPFTRAAFVFVALEYGGMGPSVWITQAGGILLGKL